MKKELVKLPKTTLDIYKYEKDGLSFFEFDATECEPPEPMVNTMNTLVHVKEPNQRLRVLFFHEPHPLYLKIDEFFEHSSRELEDGNVEVVFKKKL